MSTQNTPSIQEIISTQIGLDWLCYLAGNSQTAPTFFFQTFRICFFEDFIKNPQTTIALTFLIHIISDIGSVAHHNIFFSQPPVWWASQTNLGPS